jgi:FAD/FMN-containing dehydrogenase
LSKVVKVLTGLKTKFASRSGGHFLAPGFSSVGSDGVLIALQDLKKLSMSPDRKIATIGTGNRLRDAYAFAGNYNVTVVGGREPMVGVGGFLLGGVYT